MTKNATLFAKLGTLETRLSSFINSGLSTSLRSKRITKSLIPFGVSNSNIDLKIG